MGYALREGFHGPSGSRVRYDAAVKTIDQEVRTLFPLGDILKKGSDFIAAPRGVKAETPSYSIPRVLASLPVDGKSWVVHPESEGDQYFLINRRVLNALLDRDFERADDPLFDSFALNCGNLQFTGTGYARAMERYVVQWKTIGAIKNIGVIDGSLRGRSLGYSRTASAKLPHSTVLALNAGFEEGTYATARPELSDRVLTGRFESPHQIGRVGDPVKLYPHEKFGFHF